MRDLCSYQTLSGRHALDTRSRLIHSHWFGLPMMPILHLCYYLQKCISAGVKCHPLRHSHRGGELENCLKLRETVSGVVAFKLWASLWLLWTALKATQVLFSVYTCLCIRFYLHIIIISISWCFNPAKTVFMSILCSLTYLLLCICI